MAAQSKASSRAIELLRRLSPKGARSALEYIEFLAAREEVVLPEDEEALREDQAAAKAARDNKYKRALTTDQVRKQLAM